MIDIHSHLLPGIDDGPRDWEQSVELCRSVYEDGIRTSVATPHLIDGVYDNLRSRVEPLVAELNRRLTDAGIGLEVLAGAEVDISSGLITSASDELPRLGSGSSVLLEMPVAVVPAAMDEIIFALRSRGLIPVLAHPERNEVLQQRPTLARAWIKSGAALQLDGDSLLGVWGRHTKHCAERILRDGLFHAMASDAHSTDRRPPRLAEALKRARQLVGDGADKLVTNGPEALLDGRMPETPLYEVEAGSGSSRRSGLISRLLSRRRG